MRRFPFWLLILICGLIFLIAIGLYLYRFHYSLSYNQSIYGTFGDYLNPFLTLISIVLLTFISVRANTITETFNRVQLQPQLYLSLVESKLVPNDYDWIIGNGFEAPAINVLVRMTFIRNSENFTKWVNCFSLSKDEKKVLTWLRYADEIQVCWSDINRSQFFQIIYRDWNGTLETNFTEQEYQEALGIARNHFPNVSDLLLKDFENYFFGNIPIPLDRLSYENYLKLKDLI
jgi:hypothetical protein